MSFLTVCLKSKEANSEIIKLLKIEMAHCISEEMHIQLYPFG